jgi:hypothetical protein
MSVSLTRSPRLGTESAGGRRDARLRAPGRSQKPASGREHGERLTHFVLRTRRGKQLGPPEGTDQTNSRTSTRPTPGEAGSLNCSGGTCFRSAPALVPTPSYREAASYNGSMPHGVAGPGEGPLSPRDIQERGKRD